MTGEQIARVVRMEMQEMKATKTLLVMISLGVKLRASGRNMYRRRVVMTKLPTSTLKTSCSKPKMNVRKASNRKLTAMSQNKTLLADKHKRLRKGVATVGLSNQWRRMLT